MKFLLREVANAIGEGDEARTALCCASGLHSSRGMNALLVSCEAIAVRKNRRERKKSPLNFSKGLFYYIISSSCSLHL
ncbi:hypothetical protein [Collimonas fungivorans]|uniref:hypothetical protein n=1 Tax=Collimonas fungivorans TaxID=158899 RepID=UPI003FA3851C